MDITYLLKKLEQQGTKLVAVTKTKSKQEIEPLYQHGIRDFGENRVQELVSKMDLFPDDVRWHLIGHLQKNKVKYIADRVYMIHSVDSLDLLKEIDKRARQHARVIPCLLQFHIAQEQSKYGYTLEQAERDINSDDFKMLKNITISGVMGMGTLTDDTDLVRSEFKHLKAIFTSLKLNQFIDQSNFCEISMGMSGDYQIAIEEGSTMVRIGSLLYS